MNPYEILRIDKDADQDTIKSAYRNLAKQQHPDVSGTAGEDFIKLNTAYKILSNPETRQLYDEQGITFDEGANHIDNIVKTRVTSIANEWIDNMLKGRRVNLEDFITDKLDDIVERIDSVTEDIKEMSELLAELREKVSCTNSSNLFHQAIDQHVLANEQTVIHHKKEKFVLGKIREVLSAYKQEVDDEEVETNSYTDFGTIPSRPFKKFGFGVGI